MPASSAFATDVMIPVDGGFLSFRVSRKGANTSWF